MTLLSDEHNEVKQLYHISKLTREQLADRLGVNTGQLHLWLVGKQPSTKRQQRIRELLAEYQDKKDGEL